MGDLASELFVLDVLVVVSGDAVTVVVCTLAESSLPEPQPHRARTDVKTRAKVPARRMVKISLRNKKNFLKNTQHADRRGHILAGVKAMTLPRLKRKT